MFYKIPFTGDVYSEFSQVIVAIAIVIVLSLAWWTTNIRENWHVRTVYFFDTRLRRSRHLQRLTNHTVSSTLVESTHPSQEVAAASESGEAVAGPNNNSGGNTDENKPSDSSSSGANSEVASSSTQEDERTRIIQVMDADANVLRQRRIAFFEGRRDTLITPTEDATTNATFVTVDQQQIETVSDCPIMEHNYADRNDASTETQDAEEPPDNNIHDNIRIKLKYINDDLKLVDGRLEELLGDFKRRHFQVELATNKLVKLIFNGQVLQRDNDTLQNYGLFDNCVVHCLIHQQRVSPTEETGSGASSSASMLGNSSSRTMGGGGSSSNSNNNNRDWDLGNLLIVLISFLLSSAWYFRYQYPQFFTVTATVALVAITGIFTVVSIGMYFPDPEPVRPQAHILR